MLHSSLGPTANHTALNILGYTPPPLTHCAEARRVLGEGSAPRDELTPADVSELKYCRMVMQETLRLYTVILFVNRTATRDVALKASGKVAPKGTVVLVPLSILNRNPAQ